MVLPIGICVASFWFGGTLDASVKVIGVPFTVMVSPAAKPAESALVFAAPDKVVAPVILVGVVRALLTEEPLTALSRNGSGGVPTVLGLTVKSPTLSSSEPGTEVSCFVVSGYDARLAR